MIELKGTPALLIIDMQNGFCHERGFMGEIGLDHRSSAAAIPPIERLLAAARDASIPIVHTRYSLNEDYSDAGLLLEMWPAIGEVGGLVRGSWDAEIVAELTPREGEIVIDKDRASAFFGTGLEQQLRERGVGTTIVCGVTTNVCVAGTLRDAFAHDLRVVVPSDATAAVTPELHEAALEDVRYAFGQVATTEEIVAALARLEAFITHVT